MDAKEQYMALRAERSGLVLDQLAFYAPGPRAVHDIKVMLGLSEADWTEDTVTGDVQIGNDPKVYESRARLLFNYDLGIEVEILTYLSGPNWHNERWMANRAAPSIITAAPAFLSHIGFHVNEGELPELPFPVAQRMVTTHHTNPAIAGRSYEYVIYDTYGVCGQALKYIKRLS